MPITRGFKKKKPKRVLMTESEALGRDINNLLKFFQTGDTKFFWEKGRKKK